MSRLAAAGLLLGGLLAPATTGATYSIAAVDPATGRVGGAGASCVGRLDVAVIYGPAPGIGVAHAQSRLHLPGRDRAVQLLNEGRTPDEILAEVAARDFDRQFETRQYGVVTLAGETAAFTGRDNGAWAGDETGRVDGFVYSAQGNLLTGPPVVSRVAAAFVAGGCDLPDRLMRALEAGGAPGEGDARCTDRGVPADSAFLAVDAADGTSVLRLSAVNTGRRDPVAEVRAAYDAWRADNPCPTPDAGVPDAGTEDLGPADTGATAPPDADAPDGSDAAALDAAAADAAALTDAGPADADAGRPRRGTITNGCRAGPTASGAGFGLLGLGLLGAARRRQSARR